MSYQLTPQAMPQVTILTNEFIDKYMAAANGEYVKVYLYLLRHQNDLVELGAIAEALNHTEADVRRALAYWERMGILSKEEGRIPVWRIPGRSKLQKKKAFTVQASLCHGPRHLPKQPGRKDILWTI